jgi:hypothetical protein
MGNINFSVLLSTTVVCKAVFFSKLGRPTSWSFATDLCVELEPLLAAEEGVESLYLDVRLEDSAEEDLYPRCTQPTVQIIQC